MVEPIVKTCSLTASEQKSRHRLLRDTLIPKVRRTIRAGNSLQLDLERSGTNRELLEEFVAFEKNCCDSLSYSLSGDDTHLSLLIEAPSEVVAVIDSFYRMVEENKQ